MHLAPHPCPWQCCCWSGPFCTLENDTSAISFLFREWYLCPLSFKSKGAPELGRCHDRRRPTHLPWWRSTWPAAAAPASWRWRRCRWRDWRRWPAGGRCRSLASPALLAHAPLQPWLCSTSPPETQQSQCCYLKRHWAAPAKCMHEHTDKHTHAHTHTHTHTHVCIHTHTHTHTHTHCWCTGNMDEDCWLSANMKMSNSTWKSYIKNFALWSFCC